MNLSRLISKLRIVRSAEASAIALLAVLIMTVIGLCSARERARREVAAWIKRERGEESSFLETAPLLLEAGAARRPLEIERSLRSRGHELTRTRRGLRLVVVPRASSGKCESSVVELELGEDRIERIYRDGVPTEAMVIPGVRFDRTDPNRDDFRLYTSMSQIPQPVIDAVVAVEDRRFFSHGGLDLRAMIRALVANLRAGGAVQGGSTITQQLAKNVFLERERTLERKLREVFLAVALEEALTKRQLLEAYLNEIHFGRALGRSITGVGAAAETYFDEPIECLGLAEAAVLAGIIRAPNQLSPARHPERARERAEVVLRVMDRSADVESITFAASRTRRLAPYFADFARTEASFSGAGAIAISTVDLTVQETAEHALADGLAELDGKSKAPLEGAIVVLEVKTGKILAMVGGRDYRKSSFNRAANAYRQIGSAVKPFVALTALVRGEVDANTVLMDEPIILFTKEGPWSPRNVDYRYRGPVTLHRALTQSINLPFVQLSQEIGLRRLSWMLGRLRLRESRAIYPSLALGAFETTPVRVAAAFAAIANDGKYVEPYSVERLVDADGVTIWEHRASEHRVASRAAAFQVFDMMRAAVNYGTGYRLRRLGYRHDAAGKTGTTDETRDGWFIGIDAELAVVVWIGADSPLPTGLLAGDTAVPIWARLMNEVRRNRPPPRHAMPASLVRVDICNDSGRLATPYCPNTSRVVVRRDTVVEPCRMFEHLVGIACAGGSGNGDCTFVIDESDHDEEPASERHDHRAPRRHGEPGDLPARDGRAALQR
jgi:penicillin-binding protein 1B